MFYDNLDALCRNRGITVSGLLREIGVDRSAASRWKTKGYMPSRDVAIKIANFLGISVDDLLSEKAPAKKEAPGTKRPKGLTADEIKMLEIYRQVPDEYKALAVDMIEAALKKK